MSKHERVRAEQTRGDKRNLNTQSYLHSDLKTPLLAADMDISITDAALNQLRDVANEESVDLESTMLRIAVVPGGCSGLTYDLGWDTTVQDGDETGVIGDMKVVLDAKSSLYLSGSELHFTDGLQGDGFHFSNPQATRSCACGESFGL